MKGKVALVTGAAGGIGSEVSVLFASLGCRVALVDKGCVQETLFKCIEAGLTEEDVLPVQADLTMLDECSRVVEETVSRFGRLDILVNNAGVGCPETLVETTEEKFNSTMSINCKAVFFLSQKAVPHLARSKGNIINVSSVCGLRPKPYGAAYCASKGAVNQITQCAALEFSRHGIRVNAVNPGHIRTNIFRALGLTAEEMEECLERAKEFYPLGRTGTTDDVAKAVLFLADSGQSDFITGVCLPVDGGYNLGNAKKNTKKS